MPKTTTPTTEPDEETPKDASAPADGAPAADEPAPEQAPANAGERAPRPSAAEHRFFTWIRGLEVRREAGWVGGVCAGVATRIGIDPLIVRGIVVVLALLGAPAILVYAAAWLLLPDRAGQIHLQELLRGHVTPAFPAIVGLVLLSFLPIAQGFWWLGGLYWGTPEVWPAVARALWTAVVLAAIVVLVVWLARRASGDVTITPATTDGRPETIPSVPPADEAGADGARVASATQPTQPGEPPAPPTPPAGASDADLAAWKQSQADWQQQRAAWVAEQQFTEAQRRQAEKQARAEDWARAAAERQRIRRLTRPRASGAAVASILGLALLLGAVGAFAASGRPELAPEAWGIGVAIGTIVIGLGAIVVGLARRRAGFLAFLGIIGVLATLTTLIVPSDRLLLPEGVSYGIPLEDGTYARLSGLSTIQVQDQGGDPAEIDLWQATGDLVVSVPEGTGVTVEAVTANGTVFVDRWNADGELTESGEATGHHNDDGDRVTDASFGDESPDVVIRVWLGTGNVYVQLFEEGSS